MSRFPRDRDRSLGTATAPWDAPGWADKWKAAKKPREDPGNARVQYLLQQNELPQAPDKTSRARKNFDTRMIFLQKFLHTAVARVLARFGCEHPLSFTQQLEGLSLSAL